MKNKESLNYNDNEWKCKGIERAWILYSDKEDQIMRDLKDS